MTRQAARADALKHAKDFQRRRAQTFQSQLGFRMATDLREVGDELHLLVYRCYGDDERFPPDPENWVYTVMGVDESVPAEEPPAATTAPVPPSVEAEEEAPAAGATND